MGRISVSLTLCLLCLVFPAQAAPEALNHEEIAQALSEGRFDHLESRLNEIQQAFEANPEEDRTLIDSMLTFEDLDDAPEIRKAFDTWLAVAPESYAALLARGAYYTGLGLKARGTAYSKDTSARQFEQMRFHFNQARADLNKSLVLTAMPLGNYYELINMEMRSGSDLKIDEYHQKAMAFAPRSMEIRVLYMQNLEPRWGGSFAEMQAYIDESEKQLGPGEKLDRLRAMLPAERAHIANDAKRHSEAHELFGQAIALSDRPYYRCSRAVTSAQMKNFDQAAQDLEAAFKMRFGESCADKVAYLACCAPDMPNIADYLNRVIEKFPRHAESRVRRGWILQEQKNLAEAFVDFKVAAERGDAWAQMQVGKYLFNGWGGVTASHEEGLMWLERAAAQGELDAQYSLMEAYAYLGRHEESAAAKKRYLEMKAEKNQRKKIQAADAEDPFVKAVSWFKQNRLRIGLIGLAIFLALVLYFRRVGDK